MQPKSFFGRELQYSLLLLMKYQMCFKITVFFNNFHIFAFMTLEMLNIVPKIVTDTHSDTKN